MTDTVYCLGCGASFPTDGLTSEDHGYPLNSGMCKACVQEGCRRPWQIIAENGRLREAMEEAEAMLMDGRLTPFQRIAEALEVIARDR
jgi:hypothetical protein